MASINKLLSHIQIPFIISEPYTLIIFFQYLPSNVCIPVPDIYHTMPQGPDICHRKRGKTYAKVRNLSVFGGKSTPTYFSP